MERTTPILSLCYGVFTERSIFRYAGNTISRENLNFGSQENSSKLRRLVSKAPVGDRICGNFNLRINRSVKTPLHEYIRVVCTL